MGEVSILRGIYATQVAELVASYPVNREPVILETGVSGGYLRPSAGVVPLGAGPGADRGGINWNGVCYRVMGTKLVSVDAQGVVAVLGEVGAGGPVALDYGFDRLSINSGSSLFYFVGGALIQVVDHNLGVVIDAIWLAGYYVTTDGTSIVTTNLNAPTTVNPLHYGSSESDPDPVTGLFKLNAELYALNRYTTDVFANVGGTGFPFQVNPAASFARGCVGPRAKVAYLETYAFVGSSRNEALGVYLAGNGTSDKLSTKEIDDALALLTITEQSAVELEVRVEHDEQRLILHLPTVSYCFYQVATKTYHQKVWTVLASGPNADQPYRGRHAVQCYGAWIVGDQAGNLGTLSSAVSTQWGTVTGWRFDTAMIYAGRRFILKSATLIGLPGYAPSGVTPTIFLSVTADGRVWGEERTASAGMAGDFDRNIQWRPRRRFQTFAGLRFRGSDAGTATFASLDVDVELLT